MFMFFKSCRLCCSMSHLELYNVWHAGKGGYRSLRAAPPGKPNNKHVWSSSIGTDETNSTLLQTSRVHVRNVVAGLSSNRSPQLPTNASSCMALVWVVLPCLGKGSIACSLTRSLACLLACLLARLLACLLASLACLLACSLACLIACLLA